MVLSVTVQQPWIFGEKMHRNGGDHGGEVDVWSAGTRSEAGIAV
jgi:hypothetical protein